MSQTIYITYEYYLEVDVPPRRFKAFSSRKAAEKHFKAEEMLFGNSGGRLGGFLELKVRKNTKKKAKKK